ncbi:MAG: hypothetical protein K2G83_08130, partial [Ruminococcus sp.]|nr:hypothetical protein [Ruminococcus sp.]
FRSQIIKTSTFLPYIPFLKIQGGYCYILRVNKLYLINLDKNFSKKTDKRIQINENEKKQRNIT